MSTRYRISSNSYKGENKVLGGKNKVIYSQE